MACLVEDVRCTGKSAEKPRYSIYQDENLIYVQPATRRPMTNERPYKKPTIKIDSDTTYGTSYMKFDCVPKRRFNYGEHEKLAYKSPEQIDSETVYKLSYQAANGKVRKPFTPKSCLSINGSHDMTTIHALSYGNPGYVKVESYKPYQGKNLRPALVDFQTVTKESYQDFGMPVPIERPRKPTFWQTKSKTDYRTTSSLSYQYAQPVAKKIYVRSRPIITAQIEKDTVCKMSYRHPGHFIKKENFIYE
ncbi:uncharacterized protein LOC128886060 [Hylaeus anthracinus]|uniref:uncharacterized protein LOC128886060 n=1 Tax=Hylaeus anthracinus TaxID=313031 RepID=UPI0023B9F97F|nr:uncharacterized protein LOC128886060 [Hylaeus anthracinus]